MPARLHGRFGIVLAVTAIVDANTQRRPLMGITAVLIMVDEQTNGEHHMPTYEYRCRTCKHRFERIATISEYEKKPKQSCPKCNSRKVEQVPSSFLTVTSKKG